MKRWPLVLAPLFVLVAVWETGAVIIGPRRAASDGDWQSAAARVRAGFRPGDLIVFAPAWSDQVGRHHLGDLMPIEMVGRSDADRYGRIWEVSLLGGRGARASETTTGGARLEEESQHGRVRVARYVKTPAVVPVYDFTSSLGEALVTQVPEGGQGNETPCYRDPELGDDGVRCAGTRVARRTLEIDYRPRRGVLVPAAEGRLVTRVEYPSAALGRTLVFYDGIHDYYARKNADGPVDVSVIIDDIVVTKLRTTNDIAWRRTDIDTAKYAGGRRRVRIEVSARDARWRNFGFHAEARP